MPAAEPKQILAVVLCALIAFLDGIDSQSIALAAPLMVDGLKLERSTIGALTFGAVRNRFGRKRILILAAVIFGLFTLCTAYAGPYETVLAERLAAGLGLRGATPCSTMLASEYVPNHRRATVASVIWAAFPLGGMAGGFFNGHILGAHGWQTMFLIGGAAPIVVAVVVLGLAHAAVPATAETLRWVAPRDIGSLDPDSFGDTFNLAFLNHVYEALVRYDDALRIEPALATSWELVAPTVWRFRLRQGVRFHDGAPLTSDHVVASLVRATDDLSPLKGNLSAFKSARAVDPATVDLELNARHPLLLNDLTNIFVFSKPWLVANHTEVATDVGRKVEGYATFHANGTGPFKVESRTADSRTTLVANPGWCDTPKHNLDRIAFLPINSDATRIAALITGEVNFTNAIPLQAAQRLESQAGVTLRMATELRTVFFTFNLSKRTQAGEPNPLRDRRVRQALYQAIDIEQIRRAVMRNQARVTGALVAPAIPGYRAAQDERLAFDVPAAKALMAQVGVRNGIALTLVCTPEGYVNEEQIGQAAAAIWARIGVKVNLQLGARATTTQRRVAGKFDITPLGWANEPAIDEESLFIQVLHSKFASAGIFNWGGGWGLPEIDRLTDAAAGELDTAKRLDEEGQALDIAKEAMLFVPLHQQPMAWATRSDVTQVVQLPDDKPRHWLTRMAPSPPKAGGG